MTAPACTVVADLDEGVRLVVLDWGDGTAAIARSYPDRTLVGVGGRRSHAEITAQLAAWGVEWSGHRHG